MEVGRRPLVVVEQMSGRVTNTNTSSEAGDTGHRVTILGQDGGVGTGFDPTNPSASTDDDPADAVPTTGTTVDHNDEYQTFSFCHDRQFVESPGTRRLPGRSDEETNMAGGYSCVVTDVLTTDTESPAKSPICGVVNTVLISDVATILAPSIGLSGEEGGMKHGTDSDDAPGMARVQADMMMMDDVDNTSIPSSGVHTTVVKDEQFTTLDNNGIALPSIDDRRYSGIITSKNFTDNTNSIVLPVPTVSIHPGSGGATEPCGMKEDYMPWMIVDDAPAKGEATSSQIQRGCSYTGKGICSVHGPGAKLYWKPRTKKVIDQEGVTTLEKDLGPKGRGKLRQTSISGFLTSTRGRREGNSTVGEKTLLGDRTTTTVGQESRAVVRCSMARIKRSVGDC